jgi:hypothetical protein
MSELQRGLQPAAASKLPALPAETAFRWEKVSSFGGSARVRRAVCHNSGKNMRMGALLSSYP